MGLDRRSVFLALSLGIVLVAFIPQLLGRTSPDVSWLLYAAGRVARGDRLYVDVVETNPPLIIWLNLLPVRLSAVLGVRPDPVYQILVLALALGSVAACRRLLARLLPERADLQRYLSLVIILALFPIVGGNFGQREHLALILTLPLALLAALRMSGGAIPAGGARAIGAAAAVGIALKPYFVLPWLALEVASRIPAGPGRHGLRPETVAVAVTGALYVVLTLLLSPEYWRLAPLIAGTYYDYLRNPLAVTAVAGEGAAPTAAALLIALLLRRHARHPALWTVFGALTAGYYAAAVAQHKGWEYHFYPAFASGTMLVALVAADLRRPLGSLPRRIAAAAAQAAAVTVFALALAACLARAGDPSARRFEPDPDLPDLLPLVAERAARGPITVLSWSAVSGFPLIPDAGARSGNRFNFLWMLGSLYGPATADPAPLVYREPDRMGPLERYLNAAVAADLRRHRPALLLVLAPAPDSPEWGLRRIDLLTYFQRDPRFSEQFGRYRYLRTIGQYWVFERLPEGAPPAPPRGRASRWNPAALEAARQAQSARRLDPASVAAILLFLLSFGLAWSRGARGESRPVPDPQEVV